MRASPAVPDGRKSGLSPFCNLIQIHSDAVNALPLSAMDFFGERRAYHDSRSTSCPSFVDGEIFCVDSAFLRRVSLRGNCWDQFSTNSWQSLVVVDWGPCDAAGGKERAAAARVSGTDYYNRKSTPASGDRTPSMTVRGSKLLCFGRIIWIEQSCINTCKMSEFTLSY